MTKALVAVSERKIKLFKRFAPPFYFGLGVVDSLWGEERWSDAFTEKGAHLLLVTIIILAFFLLPVGVGLFGYCFPRSWQFRFLWFALQLAWLTYAGMLCGELVLYVWSGDADHAKAAVVVAEIVAGFSLGLGVGGFLAKSKGDQKGVTV